MAASSTSAAERLGRVMRWAQLTLVENDPGRFDPDFWLDYFRRVHADGACLSAGGCVAYYPTRVPLHYRSRWLGESDPLGYLIAGCRRMDMAVLARTDPHACHQDVHDAHPDWIAVDAQGRRRRHWSDPEYWVTCTLGPYGSGFMADVACEIVERYGVDGVFCNRWAGSGLCYCEHCQAGFRAAAGLDLPRTDDPRDPARRAHRQWKQQRLFDVWRQVDGRVRAVHPQSCFIPNVGGGALSELDMTTVGRMTAMAVADHQARSGATPAWVHGKTGKEFRAAMDGKAAAGLFSVGIEEPHRWKDSVQTEAEMRLWVLDGLAQGLRPWFCKFSGVLHDPRWLAPVERLFTWAWKNEKYLRQTANLARVGVVYAQQTAHAWAGPQARDKVEGAICGVYHALVEARVPFEMVHDGRLEGLTPRDLKLLVLPNTAALSDAQCAALRRFVEAGGSLLATLETSLYDQWGVRRSDFGLADLLGVSVAGEVQGPMKNAYLRLAHPHAVLAGLEDAPRIIHGVHRLPVTPAAAFPERPLTLIPAYPDLPMEEVYPRHEATDTPELFLRDQGAARVAYFNWDIDRTFWEVLAADHGRLLANAVRWALNEEPVVEVRGAGLLDLAVWRQEGSLTVHLVNLSNPMAMRGPCRELLPSPPQEVSLRLPAGARVGGVRLLAADVAAEARREESRLVVRVPAVLDHEVIAVDLV